MAKIRVAQCYTGPVGAEVVRRMAGHPALELVGVLVHFPEKAGRDSGELVGAAANGIVTTQSLHEIIACKPDAAIWSGLRNDLDAYERLLEAGINVYTGIGAYYLDPTQADYARLQAAGERGGASICGGGNIPGFIADVLPIFLSGYTGRIRQLRMWQRNDMAAGPSAVQIQSLGVGLEPGTGPYAELINQGFVRMTEQCSRMVAKALGIEWEGAALESVEYKLAEEDFTLQPSGLEVRQGTAASVRWTLTARAGGREFYRFVNEQSTRIDHGDDWRSSYEQPAWTVEIDGDPPILATFGWPAGTHPGLACHHLNTARAMNVVPQLVQAKPGCVSVLDIPSPGASDGVMRA